MSCSVVHVKSMIREGGDTGIAIAPAPPAPAATTTTQTKTMLTTTKATGINKRTLGTRTY